MAEGGGDYGRAKIKGVFDFNVEKLTEEGVLFEIDNSAGERISEDVKKAQYRIKIDKSFPSLGERAPLAFIPDDAVEKNDEPMLGSFEELAKEFKNVTDDGGVKSRLVRLGNQRKPPLHATVYINYEAWAETNDEPYYKTERWYKFKFFQPNIFGWLDYAISEMEQYEVSHFLVAPKYLYGDHGLLGFVPPESTVLFKVMLMKFIVAPSIPNLLALTPEERKTVVFDDYVKSVTELKEFAKKSVRDEQWGWAIERYKKAIRILESFLTIDPALDAQRNELLFTLFLNIAFCQLKCKDFDLVVYNCKKALELPPGTNGDFGKLYYRYALAEFELGHYELSKELIVIAKKKQPFNEHIHELYYEIDTQLVEDKEKQQKLFEKMCSNLSLNVNKQTQDGKGKQK